MVHKRLMHDVAFATSRHILEVIAGCLREEEQRDAFAEIYQRVKAGLEYYETYHRRIERRINPERN